MTNNWMIRGLFLAAALAFTACPMGNKCTTNADCASGQMCSVASGTCVAGTGGGIGGGGVTGGGGGVTGGGGGTTGGGGGSTGGGGGSSNNGGETCAMAQTIQPGTLMGTTAGKGNDYDPGCTGDVTPGPDAVYKISVPAGQRLSVTATPEAVTTGNQYDLAVYLVAAPESNCTAADGGDELTCLGASDNAQDIRAAETTGFTNSGSAAVDVFIFVDSYWPMTMSNPDGGLGAAAEGNFTLLTSIAAPPGGDTCEMPQTLAIGTPLTAQDLAAYSDDYDGSGTGCEGSSAGDVAYSVTVPAGQVLTVDITPEMGFDPVVSVSEDAASCSTTCIAGIDVGAGGGAERYQYRNTGNAPKTLLIVVDGYNGDLGTFTISATASTPPADDVCAAATALAAGTALTAQAITGYTNDYTGGTGCGASSGADRVYSISVPAGQRLTVTATPTAMANPSLSIVADAAACGTTCVASGTAAGLGLPESVSYTNRTGGAATYFVIVDFTSASAGTFDIVANIATPPADDVCDGATALTAGAAALAGTTVGYTNDYVNGTGFVGCASSGVLDADRVYSVSVPNGERATVTVTPTADAGFNPSVSLVDGPAANCAAMPRVCVAGSNTALANAPESVSIFNTSGGAKTYFAVVDSTTAPSAFTIGYTSAAPATDDTCTTNTTALTSGVAVTGNLTGFGADYVSGTNCFAASGPDRVYRAQLAADQKLTLNLTPTGVDGGFDPVVNFIPGPATNCDNTPRTCSGGIDFTLRNQAETGGFTNNTGAAMTLFVVVADYETNSTNRDFTMTGTIAAAPAGESCRIPQALTAGVLAAQTLAGASSDVVYGMGATATCSAANGAPDRVYSVSVPNGQTLTVAVAPTTAADFAVNIIDGPATACTNVTACLDTADNAGSSTTAETATFQNTSGAAKSVFVQVIPADTAALSAPFTVTTTLQ